MSLNIIASANSFIQWSESNVTTACGQHGIELCLPVYDANDIWFQFVIEADTIAEADALCDRANAAVVMGIRLACSDPNFATFIQKPDRFRISERQVLYNWQHPIVNFDRVAIGDCFYFSVTAASQTFCSNCLQKIINDCHTSVIEYGNDEDAFGFNYCNSATTDDDVELDCSPQYIQFTNVPTLVIPYTASMRAKYGDLPSVSTWIYAPDSSLQAMGIEATFDAYPVNTIYLNFGGPASGVIRIS